MSTSIPRFLVVSSLLFFFFLERETVLKSLSHRTNTNFFFFSVRLQGVPNVNVSMIHRIGDNGWTDPLFSRYLVSKKTPFARPSPLD